MPPRDLVDPPERPRERQGGARGDDLQDSYNQERG